MSFHCIPEESRKTLLNDATPPRVTRANGPQGPPPYGKLTSGSEKKLDRPFFKNLDEACVACQLSLFDFSMCQLLFMNLLA